MLLMSSVNNNTGHNTELWGTPNMTFCNCDLKLWIFNIEICCVRNWITKMVLFFWCHIYVGMYLFIYLFFSNSWSNVSNYFVRSRNTLLMFPKGTPKHLDPLYRNLYLVWFGKSVFSCAVYRLSNSKSNTLWSYNVLSGDSQRIINYTYFIFLHFTLSVQDLPLWRCIKEIQRNGFKERSSKKFWMCLVLWP